jgi:hypothetical protein
VGVRETRGKQVALEHIQSTGARVGRCLGGDLHPLRLPPALDRVPEQPAGGAAHVEQSSGGAESGEVVQQPAALAPERGVVERRGGTPPAAELALEVGGIVEARERRGSRARREESHPAGAALDQRIAPPLVPVGERHWVQAAAAAGETMVERFDGGELLPGIHARTGSGETPRRAPARSIGAPPSTWSPR